MNFWGIINQDENLEVGQSTEQRASGSDCMDVQAGAAWLYSGDKGLNHFWFQAEDLI